MAGYFTSRQYFGSPEGSLKYCRLVKYPAILAGQPSNKVFIIRLLSSHLHEVFIVLHSHKNRSMLFDLLKFVALFPYRSKTGSFIRDCDWLLGARVTSFSRLFRTRAHIYANTSSSLSLLMK